MREQLPQLADGLFQIGKGPTSLWLYVRDGVLYLPTKGLDPVGWLGRTVMMVNGRPFLRAREVVEIDPKQREYVEAFCAARRLKL
jgi:hypothetical protein